VRDLEANRFLFAIVRETLLDGDGPFCFGDKVALCGKIHVARTVLGFDTFADKLGVSAHAEISVAAATTAVNGTRVTEKKCDSKTATLRYLM